MTSGSVISFNSRAPETSFHDAVLHQGAPGRSSGDFGNSLNASLQAAGPWHSQLEFHRDASHGRIDWVSITFNFFPEVAYQGSLHEEALLLDDIEPIGQELLLLLGRGQPLLHLRPGGRGQQELIGRLPGG